MDEAKPLPSASPDDLPIDVDLLKVLASDTRRDILRLLQKRRMTLSEMSVALNLKKATVLEHLKKLTEAGLIRRLEDERLWVYYELTHRGGRLVNPGRTRFFLVLGMGAAAALVLAGIAFAAVVSSPMGDDAASSVGHGGLRAEIAASDSLAAGAPVALKASVLTEQGPVEPRRALLLSAHDARAVQEGNLQGIELVSASADGGAVEFRSAQPVPAGDYFLYVADGAGHDNADNLTPLRVPAYAVDGPAVAWRGVDSGATFAVRRDAEPVNGTLLLLGDASAESLPLVNGTATLAPERLDALAPATYRMQLAPPGGNASIPLDARLEVRDPLAVVAPLDVAQAATRTLTLTMALAPPYPPMPEVRVAGEAAGIMGAGPGAYSLRIDASQPGVVPVQVGRLVTHEVVVHPDVRLALAPRGDGAHNLTALRFDGAPAENFTVLVDAVDLGRTNESGHAIVTLAGDGTRLLALRSPDDALEVRRALRVEGWNVTEVRPEVDATLETPVATHEALDVRLHVRQEPTAVERPVLLALSLDDTVFASARPQVGNETSTLTFRLASPPPGSHRLAVQIEPLGLSPVGFHNGTVLARFTDNATVSGSTQDASAPPPQATSPSPAPTTAPAAPAAGSEDDATRVHKEHAWSADSAYAFRVSALDLGGRLVADVVVPALVPPPPPVTPTTAADGRMAAPEAQVPGGGALGLALAAVAAALVAARRRRAP